ncbi:hypothetical protein CLOSTMETH_02843 [[Clostridium] methylpentosum DSM 5476]|uniref:Uncharacterized protein n=1 Tax=[Clostridium] methylpentosum DSM 5476 TaxID=537013 RepID=C0EG51_9FIRM|nr:hypothetical protein CLOSTMETH_02843 [[Clostridium] methylpentosum DSM 5476]
MISTQLHPSANHPNLNENFLDRRANGAADVKIQKTIEKNL